MSGDRAERQGAGRFVRRGEHMSCVDVGRAEPTGTLTCRDVPCHAVWHMRARMRACVHACVRTGESAASRATRVDDGGIAGRAAHFSHGHAEHFLFLSFTQQRG